MDLLLLFLLYFLCTHFCISVHKLNPQGKIETFPDNDNVHCVKPTSFRILEDADASFSSTNRRKEKPEKGDFYFLSQMDANAKKGA